MVNYMKKIVQGKFDVCTSKVDAIDKLMQLQGVCQEKNSNNCRIEFHCNKHGKIIIESQVSRHSPKKAKIFTKLYGNVTKQNNKTYVNYYISFDKNGVFRRLSAFLIAAIVLLFFLVFVPNKTKVLIALILCIIGLIFQLFSIEKEKSNLNLNSDTLIKVLENKVNIVNNWEK